MNSLVRGSATGAAAVVVDENNFMPNGLSATSMTEGEAWKERHFYPDELDEWFGLRTVNSVYVPDSLRPYIEAHDVKTDSQYTNDPDLYENYARVYGPALDHGNVDDRRLYVKWTGPDRKFGVFTNSYIPPFSFVTQYTGALINTSRSTDYEWHYFSKITDKEGNEMSMGVDSQLIGNIARFVNHEDKPNTDVIYVPHNNVWQPIYIATKPIYPGMEVTVSYGANYWTSRDRIKAEKD
ncbi:hypothetical protein DFS34DRAFT_627443 [Phlyctochytrium arcticum]|nr:hypothetical protein DFS34DRAFT_627443 [Phlyctochytrium arcticum]